MSYVRIAFRLTEIRNGSLTNVKKRPYIAAKTFICVSRIVIGDRSESFL
jgi:hypothetical protein